MKSILTAGLMLGLSSTVSAAIIHFDIGSFSIPADVDGIFINILDGSTTTSFPNNFNDAPWINLYYGGTGIGSSNLLRPWASSPVYDDTTDYFVNLASGTQIDASGVFVSGEAVSSLHIGGGADQFQSGVKGYLAFEYMASPSSGAAYGWISFTPNDAGSGSSFDLVYSDTPGEAITVGAIPEPASIAALAGAFGLGFAVYRRRRTSAIN